MQLSSKHVLRLVSDIHKRWGYAFSLLVLGMGASLHADAFKDIGKFVTKPPQQHARDVAQFAKKVGMTIQQAEIALNKTTESILDSVDAISNLVTVTKQAVNDIKAAAAMVNHAKNSQQVIDPVFTFVKAPLAIHVQAIEVLTRLTDTIFQFSKYMVRPFNETAHIDLATRFGLPVFLVIAKIDETTQKINSAVSILESTTRKVNSRSLAIVEYVKKSPLSSKKY
jgi:hypothetical protein